MNKSCESQRTNLLMGTNFSHLFWQWRHFGFCSVLYVSVNSKGAHPPAPSNWQCLRHLNFRKLHNQITPCQGTEKLSNSNSPEHSSYVRLYTIVNTSFLCNVFHFLLGGNVSFLYCSGSVNSSVLA